MKISKNRKAQGLGCTEGDRQQLFELHSGKPGPWQTNGWGPIMLEHPWIHPPSLCSVALDCLVQISENIQITCGIDAMTLRNKFVIDYALTVKKEYHHNFDTMPVQPDFLRSWLSGPQPRTRVLLCRWVIWKQPSFVTGYDSLHQVASSVKGQKSPAHIHLDKSVGGGQMVWDPPGRPLLQVELLVQTTVNCHHAQSKPQRQFLDWQCWVSSHSLPDLVDDLCGQFQWVAAPGVVLGWVVATPEMCNPAVDSGQMQHCTTMMKAQPVDNFDSCQSETNTEVYLNPLSPHIVIHVILGTLTDGETSPEKDAHK